MYKGSSNTSVVKKRFESIEEFEKYINDPFRKVVEILHYNEETIYVDNVAYQILGVNATMIIDNTVY